MTVGSDPGSVLASSVRRLGWVPEMGVSSLASVWLRVVHRTKGISEFTCPYCTVIGWTESTPRSFAGTVVGAEVVEALVSLGSFR